MDPLGLDTTINGQNHQWNGGSLEEVEVKGKGKKSSSGYGNYGWSSNSGGFGGWDSGPGAAAEQRLRDGKEELERISVKEKGEGGSVGQPGFGESLIPVWGSARAAVDDFQNGRWGWGIFNSVMAVSDVFLVKTLFTAAGKVALKGVVSFETQLLNKGILGFTEHGTEQMLERGFTQESIMEIISKGSVNEVIHKGQPQIHYILGEYKLATPIGGLNNGKVISVMGDYNIIRFSNGIRGPFTGF